MIDNNHRLKLLMIPDAEVGPKEEQGISKRLEQLKKSLNEDEKKNIVQDAFKLKQH